jgi:hypothetical protein
MVGAEYQYWLRSPFSPKLRKAKKEEKRWREGVPDRRVQSRKEKGTR